VNQQPFVIDVDDPDDTHHYRAWAQRIWAFASTEHAINRIADHTYPDNSTAVRIVIPISMGITATSANDLADALYRVFGPINAFDPYGAINDPAWPSFVWHHEEDDTPEPIDVGADESLNEERLDLTRLNYFNPFWSTTPDTW
jgi:hypothetical protein